MLNLAGSDGQEIQSLTLANTILRTRLEESETAVVDAEKKVNKFRAGIQSRDKIIE